jgi:hypothetical protein
MPKLEGSKHCVDMIIVVEDGSGTLLIFDRLS